MEKTYNQVPNYSMPGQNIPSESAVPPKKSFLLKIIIAIIIVVAVILAGFTIVLAARIWDPLWSPFRLSPEEVISKMVKNMVSVQKVHYIAEYSVEKESTNELTGMFYWTTKWEMNLDFSNPDEIQSLGLIYEKGESEELGLSEFEYEVVSRGKPTFIKVIKSDSEEMPKNQWMILPFVGDDYKSIIEQVIKAFKNKEVYSLEQEFPDEEISGVKVYHYKVSFNSNVAFLMTNNFRDLSPGNLMDIYIGKRDNLIYKLILSGRDELNSEVSKALLYVELSNYNESLFDSYGANNEVFAYNDVDIKNIFIESYLRRLGIEAISYASDNHKSYSGFCDTERVKGFNNKIKEFDSSIICNDSIDAWAATAKLLDANVYFCVDSKEDNVKRVSEPLKDNTFCL